MRKIVVVGLVVLTLIFGLVGCGNSGSKTETGEDGTKEPFEYETIGKIIEFDKNEVHIITGDVAKIYAVDENDLADFYIGQLVSVKKLEDMKYELKEYKETDFDRRYTNMGDLINTITGILTNEDDGQRIKVTNNSQSLVFELDEKIYVDEGSEITVDYISINEKLFLTDYFIEGSKIELEVKKIVRSESDGTMLLETVDEKNIQYNVTIGNGTVRNFNLSEIIIGNKLTAYPPDVMLEIYPNQFVAKKLLIK